MANGLPKILDEMAALVTSMRLCCENHEALQDKIVGSVPTFIPLNTVLTETKIEFPAFVEND